MNEDFYTLMYRLEYLIRYSNVPRIHDESVASHSFFVAVILIDLHERYEFDLPRAIKLAICHDMPEVLMNDVSHETKRLFPELKVAMEKVETDIVLNRMPLTVGNAIIEFNLAQTVEAKFANLADAIQCYQYASNEISLGNAGYMLEVKVNSKLRLDELTLNLHEYLNDV